MTGAPPSQISLIFDAIQNGDANGQERLFEAVYDELHRMAHQRMRHERPGQTLQTTGLVHEAFLRLNKSDQTAWENRRHFFGAAARAMRCILIDRAREAMAIKREGWRNRVPLTHDVPDEAEPTELVALDQALTELEEAYPRAAEVVKHRYFLGLTEKEVAALLDVTQRTVASDWQLAKAWLRKAMTESADGADAG